MECNEDVVDKDVNISAVNSTILDYYRKFGRNRDLEQFFSLSTAQVEVQNPTGTFWRNMKVLSDSSDSGGKKSESSQELCRISIRCSVPDPTSSQDENTKSKSESVSPPIMMEDHPPDISRPTSRGTDEGSGKSGDENSQKSSDVVLDTSMNKPISPSSSVTSQRKLEWDSLADVGYANESDRKMSASSLSTLERLALQQQYSNNETRQGFGLPTAHSTPLDENDNASKGKKGLGKIHTKTNKTDVESIQLLLPNSANNKNSQSFNVHLTKHISFCVDESGEIVMDKIKNNDDVSPKKVTVGTVNTPHVNLGKEIQTTSYSQKSITSDKNGHCSQKTPILMSVNTLKKKNRRRKLRIAQKKARNKKTLPNEEESIIANEKSGDQLTEAESFEYMPGHIYNQNHLNIDNSLPKKVESNKSSLESSALTTDSSNGTKHSFTKDLEKSIEVLKGVLQLRHDDNLKNKLVKEIIQRLLKSKYRDDDSTTDFLSGLSFASKKIGLDSNNSTSTPTSSDGNGTAEKRKMAKPKKSILRIDKFNANAIASTSQSAPNLSTAIHGYKQDSSKHVKNLTSSYTDSDVSGQEKVSTDSTFARTSSEELYRKYLNALRREEAYKTHLKDKDFFFKPKLTCSDSAFKIPTKPTDKRNSKFQHLINDLIRNNYDDGSGDAGKLKGGSDSRINYEEMSQAKNHRSHSVYTLSSCNSSSQSKKPNLKKRLQTDFQNLSKPGPSSVNNHYCCCPHHSKNNEFAVTDSSVQVNLNEDDPLNKNAFVSNKCLNSVEHSQKIGQLRSNQMTDEIKYICLCSKKVLSKDICDKVLIYKCAPISNKGVQSNEFSELQTESIHLRSNHDCSCKNIEVQTNTIIPNLDSDHYKKPILEKNTSSDINLRKVSKSSQTNLLLNMLCEKPSDKSSASSNTDLKNSLSLHKAPTESKDFKVLVHEATRCIQTEISINPKISDPSLPDIHIINDAESVKMISEQVKEVSRHTSVIDLSNREVSNVNELYTKQSNKHVISEEKITEPSKKEIQEVVVDKLSVKSPTKDVEMDNTDSNNADFITDNFTIPIQGTNMKLMVSIGSNNHRSSTISETDSKQLKQGLLDKADYSQGSTSAGEESCNSVQYEGYVNRELKTNNKNIEDSADHNIHSVVNKKHINVQYPPIKKSCCSVDINDLKLNTYPINKKRPLRRTNTDTEIIDANTQTNNIHKNDVIIQKTDTFFETGTKISTETNTSEMPKYSINDNMIKRKHSSAKSPKEVTTRDIETQSDFIQSILPKRSTNNDNANKPYNSSKLVGNNNVQVEETEISSQPKNLNSQSEISPEIQSVYDSDVVAVSTEETSKSSNDRSEKLITHLPVAQEDDKSACNRFKDPILDIIKDITKRYSKDDVEKHKRRKCFKEIVTVLNYLLDTDDSTDQDRVKPMSGSASEHNSKTKCETKIVTNVSGSCQTINKVDKSVQMTLKKSKNKLCNTESSDLVTTTDIPGTSSDSTACKVLNKIKKECERYHQKRCKPLQVKGNKCDESSSTSNNCNQCNKLHHCGCRLHKCNKTQKSKSKIDKGQKKSVAYNLIIQTSESIISEDTVCDDDRRPLQNIIIKVPSRGTECFIPFKELERKIEKKMSHSPRCDTKYKRSKSCPNAEVPSTDDSARPRQECTVREYLEINRPDFIEKSVQRQDCLKVINESRDTTPRLKMVVVHTPNCMYCGGVPMPCSPCYDPCVQTIQNEVTRIANERAVSRKLLSTHVDSELPLSELNINELRQLARDIGIDSGPKNRTPKFLSEQDMKKHSEKIYKSLPEVKQKKELVKKENIKKTNLLMANMFKKNLQKKVLRGTVNLSNYSTVIKI